MCGFAAELPPGGRADRDALERMGAVTRNHHGCGCSGT